VPEPSLNRQPPAAGDPVGVALLLHGGRPSSVRPVDGRSASWRRMAALQRAVAAGVREDGVATWLLRYRHRGWNGGTAPVADARWALDRVREHLGALPVVLVGHSMGARVALHVADDPAVTAVVALAPWLERDTPVSTLAGRSLVAAHGRRDRITSFRATRRFVELARAAGVDASFADMGRRGHYLLSGAGAWNDLAVGAVRSALVGGRDADAV
jgi:predicted esterase